MANIPIPRTRQERAIILDKASKHAGFRERVRQQAAEDGIFFTNLFLWTFDPRPTAPEPNLPFFLYPFQEDTWRKYDAAIEKHDDVVLEKSRDMGLTWLSMAWCLHKWLFRPGTQILIGSRNESMVWNKTMDSHFGKIQHMLEQLPGWLLPVGFDFDKHFLKLKLIHPGRGGQAKLRGNTIKGEASTGQFSRAGRYLAVLFDEAGFWENFSAAWRAAGSTTKTRIGWSTPNGMNSWGKLIHHPLMQSKRITLHWRLHPLHDDAWYAAECARLVSDEDIAQELDISYQRSQRGRVYPGWDHVQVGVYEYHRRWSTYVSWDFGLDTTAMIWWQRDAVTGQVRMIDCYSNAQRPIDFYIPFVTGELLADNPYLREYTADEIAKITIHSQWGRPIHFGDPSVNQRHVETGTSAFDVLRAAGIYVITNPSARDHKTRKRFTQLGLKGLEVNVSDDPDAVTNCAAVDDAMRAYHYPNRNPDSQRTTEAARPVHDDSSHFATCVEYFFVNLPPHRTSRVPESYTDEQIYDKLI